jgi:RsiW-degrading membrane proteinase PrsW (M82 family)
MEELEEPATSPRSTWAPRWWIVLLIGLALWLAAISVTYLTADLILLPTIVLLGSFLVPVTGVVWYLDHDPSPELSPRRILSAFIVAGAVGVLAAAVLEYFLVNSGFVGSIQIGLIEEFVKGALILVAAYGIRNFHTRDGMVLGAAIGFGFAALESSGYALVALFVIRGQQLFLSLGSVVTTELVRGILAPFGHGMWTAILGGVIFSVARRGHLYLVVNVLLAYLLVAGLHAAWDAINNIVGYAVISAIGLVPLVWLWRRGDSAGVLRRRPYISPAGG